MIEHNYIVASSMNNGLAPRAKMRPNAPYLEVSQNLKGDASGGLISPDAITYPISGVSVSWPFPQLFRGEKTTILLGGTDGYTINESTWDKTAFAINPYTVGLSWQHASFQETWFATNGTQLLYADVRNDHVPKGYTALTVRSLAAHQDRLFLAGLGGAHLSSNVWLALFDAWRKTRPDDQVVHEDMAVGGNWVLWSQRGGGEHTWPFAPLLLALGFDSGEVYDPADDLAEYFREQIVSGELGLSPCRWPGNILAMKPLGEYGLVLYGETGISQLSPEQNALGYREEKVHDIGLLSRNAIGGDNKEHVFLDQQRRLRHWRLGEGLRLMDYAHIFTESGGSPEILVSFDALQREWWICDGTWSYIFDGEALYGPMDYKPTSLVNGADGQLAGPASGLTGPFTCIVRTCPLDLNERGLKHCPQVSVSMRGLTATKCWIEYANSNRNAYRPGRVVPMNYNGVGFPKTSFSDGKLVVQGTSTGSAELHRIDMRWQAEDARYRRGTQAAPEVG